MKLHKLRNGSGEVYAFEIGSFPLGRGSVAYFLAKMKELKIKRWPRHFSGWREDVFCTFEMDDALFEVRESSGRRSRYRIGPRDNKKHEGIDLLIDRFIMASTLWLFLNGLLYEFLDADTE
jgi:hypothetical protein